MEEKEIIVKGLKTNYKINGEGKPLIILHGWGVSSDLWVNIIENIPNRLIICPDIPGFGKSETPKEAWNVSDYSNWLKEFVDKVGLKKFDILAHSFGGRIAIKFLQENQEIIDKLILHGAAGIKTKLSLKQRIIKNGSNLSPRFVKVVVKKILDPLLKEKDYYKAEGIMKEIIKKVIEEDLFPLLSQINKETLLVWGENDKFVPLKYAKMFNEKISRSKLFIIKDAGHSAFKTHPDKFLTIILSFLN